MDQQGLGVIAGHAHDHVILACSSQCRAGVAFKLAAQAAFKYMSMCIEV